MSEPEEPVDEKKNGSAEPTAETTAGDKKSDPPKAEAKKSDPPKAEAKKSDPPKAEAKKSDPPKAEAKKSDPPKAEPAGGRKHAPAPALARAVSHEHAPDRREYWRIWAVLLVLTILEVGLAKMRGHIGRTPLVTGMIGMALAKAGCVALFYMHLKHESKVMRWTVAFPVLFPALYAFILIAEGAYRSIWGA